MHIPVQVDYGVRALVDIAEREGEGSVRASEIARRKGIPEPYLARVLLTLQRSGVVKSQRGPRGGHSLARDASEISMGMVMDSLGGTRTLVSCLDHAEACDQAPTCSQRDIWREVDEAVQRILDSTSIAELVNRLSRPEPVAPTS
jgi:Rrf2 family protein